MLTDGLDPEFGPLLPAAVAHTGGSLVIVMEASLIQDKYCKAIDVYRRGASTYEMRLGGLQLLSQDSLLAKECVCPDATLGEETLELRFKRTLKTAALNSAALNSAALNSAVDDKPNSDNPAAHDASSDTAHDHSTCSGCQKGSEDSSKLSRLSTRKDAEIIACSISDRVIGSSMTVLSHYWPAEISSVLSSFLRLS